MTDKFTPQDTQPLVGTEIPGEQEPASDAIPANYPSTLNLNAPMVTDESGRQRNMTQAEIDAGRA